MDNPSCTNRFPDCQNSSACSFLFSEKEKRKRKGKGKKRNGVLHAVFWGLQLSGRSRR
jgi:hypothetical protein